METMSGSRVAGRRAANRRQRTSIIVLTVAAVVCSLSAEVQKQTITERLHDPSRPAGEPIVVIPPLGTPLVLTLEQLTRGSTVVAEARISPLRVAIDETDRLVVTSVAIHPTRVLSGAMPAVSSTPGVAVPLVLTVPGGTVRKDGVDIRADGTGYRPLETRGLYLLFLSPRGKKLGEFSLYDYAAFEVSNDALQPLLFDGKAVFRDFVWQSYSQIVSRIQTASRDR